MSRLVRRTLAAFLVLVTAALVAATASAAPPVTETTKVEETDTFVDVLTSCGEDAPLYEITIDYILVEHETTFGDGRVHATFTQTGKFVAEALEPGELDASGTFAIWGNFNANGKTVNGTFTFNLSGKYSDGTNVGIHVTDHFNTTPTGSEFAFFHCRER
jgi:hypothetical protein